MTKTERKASRYVRFASRMLGLVLESRDPWLPEPKERSPFLVVQLKWKDLKISEMEGSGVWMPVATGMFPEHQPYKFASS